MFVTRCTYITRGGHKNCCSHKTMCLDVRTIRIIFFPSYSFSTRLSIDIVSSMPTQRGALSINGNERSERLLARFAVGDYHQKTNVYHSDKRRTVTEIIKCGIHDLASGNPNQTTQLLNEGTIYDINVYFQNRYFENGKTVTLIPDFEFGFFHLQLLLSKKIPA